MAVAVSYDVDYGSRNAVLRQLGLAAGLTATALDQTAGETHPNWVAQINKINVALGLPTYSNLDRSAFQTVVGAIVAALNAPPPVPTITTPPAVTPAGTQVNGTVLTTTNGVWTNSPSSYTRSWQRDGAAINPAQTGVTYTTVAADATHTVRCSVVAVNAGGNSTASNSNGVAID
jgi:hypothetical protein